jgi:hypothetical protein
MKTMAQRRQKAVHLTKRAGRLLKAPMKFVHIYEIRPRADEHGVDLVSDALPYSPLWYRGPNAIRDAIGYAKFYSGSHDAVIRVFDAADNVIETQEHAGEFKGR